MSFAPVTGVNPGTRLASTDDEIIRQVICNADGSAIAGGGTGAGAEQVQGNAATGAVPLGNPLQTGGVVIDPASLPSLTVGRLSPLALDKAGVLLADTRLLTSADVVTNVPKGAANQASGQVTTSTTAATLVAARSTRRSVTIKNTDAAIVVYVGPATVTAGNGMPLKGGESINIDTVALIQVIAASATPVVAYYETYD